MESLYTKYRPKTFEEVVGQEHVVETLKRAVLEGKVSHAYLFCGPRGTGKTTMARILAKALMCQRGAGHLPDGTCEECQLIAAGEHPDVLELDAASRTGVDNVREEIISRLRMDGDNGPTSALAAPDSLPLPERPSRRGQTPMIGEGPSSVECRFHNGIVRILFIELHFIPPP